MGFKSFVNKEFKRGDRISFIKNDSKYALKGENRKPFSDDHVEILLRVSWRRR